MSKVLSSADAIRRPYLVEYDGENPSPHFSQELLRYIRSVPDGLSEKALANLRSTEWFVLNRNSGGLISCAVPGLRVQPDIEVIYVKRFNADLYNDMIKSFLEFIPEGFPDEQSDYVNMPGYRLTSVEGDRFYPIKYNNDLQSWRMRVAFAAEKCKTDIARFENGLFVLSNGGKIDLGDLLVDWVGRGDNPPGW